jgi:hypothetical protein
MDPSAGPANGKKERIKKSQLFGLTLLVAGLLVVNKNSIPEQIEGVEMAYIAWGTSALGAFLLISVAGWKKLGRAWKQLLPFLNKTGPNTRTIG